MVYFRHNFHDGEALWRGIPGMDDIYIPSLQHPPKFYVIIAATPLSLAASLDGGISDCDVIPFVSFSERAEDGLFDGDGRNEGMKGRRGM